LGSSYSTIELRPHQPNATKPAEVLQDFRGAVSC